ncbi:MAG: DUF2807 domain-containing protein [Rhodothermales bacterium]|nr:DUF2807 domain-containing protein [Rhodothermales bacterium]MBO6779202.1 DUF2807 domain-containing protein [Rhodothermales bacterium]
MKPSLLILFAFLPLTAQAQRVDGNGDITTQTRPLSQFSAISLDFVAEVQIRTGAAPGIEITVDKNILPYIGTRVSGGKLEITQEAWIEPTQKAIIHVTTPLLAALETSGYSTVRLLEPSGPRLTLDVGVGDLLVLGGEVDELTVATKQGSIDASRLAVKRAVVSVTGRGKVQLKVRDELALVADEDATIVVDGNPRVSGATEKVRPAAEYKTAAAPRVARVLIRIKNNRLWWSKLRVEGPEGARFGYGFGLGPRAARTETWPIGTRVYRVEGEEERLLYTVARADSGKTVSLFSR